MKIEIDTDKCVGAGVCVLAAPQVFDQNDDDGIVVVLDDQPDAARLPGVRDAAARCPAAVIQVHETV